MANARLNDSSDASSSVNVPAVSVKRSAPHPEEWTLPHEHSMEKREKFENWRMDLQTQIAGVAINLSKSLREYPNEDAGDDFDYSDEIIRAKYAKDARMYARQMGETLNLGLARVPVMANKDKY
ncbi:uncharacterized protein LOC127708074 [Mytilus californianus]|uniref:uncharacterized protein LOC127708074 n=1 Tax=Mytilus californianus TaxID=6549 RepID=UPI0022459A86|nr:uncharacterized protein LOC127708074 [Mytilus californianus]